MKFTYDAYQKLIELLIKNDYEITNYKNCQMYEKAAIIRHDVDMSLKKALQMAEFEKRLNVSSTYYVLVSSDFYNIFSKKSCELIREILRLGHDIGLHFDEKKYSGTEDILEAVEEEIGLLEKCTGNRVESISMHMPSEKTLRADYQIRGGVIINSYGKKFFREFKYISDSRKCWHEDIAEAIKSGKYNRLHILVHPIWYSDEEETMKQQMLCFCKAAVGERYNILCENISDFNRVLMPEELR